MARDTDRPRRSLFILVPLATTAAGGLAANLFFPQFAFVGYLVCGWGDALGEPVGSRWGKHGYRVPSIGGIRAHRTLEGSLAVCLGGAVAAATGLYLFGLTPVVAVGAGIACGVFGALVEAVSNHGLDNFTIQDCRICCDVRPPRLSSPAITHLRPLQVRRTATLCRISAP
jgi:phytol kinase